MRCAAGGSEPDLLNPVIDDSGELGWEVRRFANATRDRKFADFHSDSPCGSNGEPLWSGASH